MKEKLIVLFIIGMLSRSLAQNKELSVIVENDNYGYIDKTGKVIIAPQYKNAGGFSEGLAPVRINGKYGYIDQTGTLIIPPKYDLATDFHNGIACGFVNGSPSFIDRNGNVILSKPYTSLRPFGKNLAVVGTASKQYGIINPTTGKLIVDTVYNDIGSFENGVAIVKKKSADTAAVIDTLGNFIVPFGKYNDIQPFVDGYAKVAMHDRVTNTDIDGAIDTQGKLIFQRPQINESYLSEDFHDGLAVAYLEKQPSKNVGERVQGYVNLKGEVVYTATPDNYLKNFCNGRIFLEDADGGLKMVNSEFKKVGTATFDQALEDDCFPNGYFIVAKKGQWGIIDVNGNFVVNPEFEEIYTIKGDYFFYTSEDEEGQRSYGMGDLKGNILIQPIISEFDPSGFQNGLLNAIVNDRLTYFDTLGNIIWQENKTVHEPKALDIDFMNRGYFYAFSESNEGDLGGHGGSQNFPKKIGKEDFPKGKLSVTVSPSKDTLGNGAYKAYQVYVSNCTNEEALFNAQDSRLYMTVEAKDPNGKWKPIEYAPSSWCGNSYHTLSLEKNNYWTFQTPVYEGEFKTKLRIALNYIDFKSKDKKRGMRKELTVYSNEYEGGVNPGQFWNKRDYFPGGIMDPYNE